MGGVWAFRFACSSAFSPIENEIGDPNSIGSVTMGIGERIINGETPELFYSNGQIVYKIKDKDDLILLLDPMTGIVRDVANGITGAYCYHNQITNRVIQLAQNLTSNDTSVQPDWQDSISEVSISLGTFASILGTAVSENEDITKTILVPLLPLMPIKILDTLRPGSIAEAERNGLFTSTTYLIPLMSKYWDTIKEEFQEDLQHAISDFISISNEEKENDSTYMGIIQSSLTEPFIISGYGESVGEQYTWIHINARRNSYYNTNGANGYWVMECVVTYDIGDNKKHTETQYWVLLGGKLGIFVGGSHSFKFRLPHSEQRIKITDVNVSYRTFWDMINGNI